MQPRRRDAATGRLTQEHARADTGRALVVGPYLKTSPQERDVQRSPQARMDEAVGLALAIDLDVVDTYAGPDRQVELSYTLRPGDTPGSVLADDTGSPSFEVTVDRHGHLAAAPHTCPYCQQVSCTACPDDTRPCPVCAVPICAPCLAALGFVVEGRPPDGASPPLVTIRRRT